jgi:hypothetical protein
MVAGGVARGASPVVVPSKAAEEVVAAADAAGWVDADSAEDATVDADLMDVDAAAAEGEESDAADEDASDTALLEFGPFQAAANVMPYNMAVDPGHNFMNPFLRGHNPAYDGFTPQPGGQQWNNPNGPNWSPFHWSAPPNYWSVYPPQYASHYVDPSIMHAPDAHQFYGPTYNGQHNHYHPEAASWPYGSTDPRMHGSSDPHIYGPHLDWPFGALTSDMDHIPGMGTGVNTKLAFPQFVEVTAAEAEAEEDGFEGTDAVEEETAAEGEGAEAPPKPECVNCAYRD